MSTEIRKKSIARRCPIGARSPIRSPELVEELGVKAIRFWSTVVRGAVAQPPYSTTDLGDETTTPISVSISFLPCMFFHRFYLSYASENKIKHKTKREPAEASHYEVDVSAAVLSTCGSVSSGRACVDNTIVLENK